MSDRHIRSIVRDELATNEIWNLFFGNPQMERAVTRNVNSYLDTNLSGLVSNSVHTAVTSATQRVKIDALESVNDLLKNDMRMQGVITSSVAQTQQMVAGEVNKGEVQIANSVKREVSNVVSQGRYNSVNKGFLDNLSLQCASALNTTQSKVTAEIAQLHAANESIVQMKTEMSHINKKIQTLQDDRASTIITSTVLGAAVGVGVMTFLETLKKP